MEEIIKSDIYQYINAYERIFDNIRIVDPIEKKVIKQKDKKVIPGSVTCYSLWQDNKECKDCISMKALINEKAYTKIQHNADKMFLMFASPLKVNGKKLVLELIKDITEGLSFETVNQSQGHELRNIVEDLNTLILKDSLTNLYNRRYIDQKLPREINRCTDRRPLSVAMVDIDHFKYVNDTYGHNAGDVVLKKLSKILSKSIRDDSDWVARYGGEELLICLPKTDNKKAYQILERIRKSIERKTIKVEDKEIKITCSFGLCTIKDHKLKSVDINKRSDGKIIEAKNQGRNKVVS